MSEAGRESRACEGVTTVAHAVTPPKAFYFAVGGYPAGQSAVLWRRGVLRCVAPMSQLGDASNLLVSPTEDECLWFAGRLRQLGVYQWARSYDLPEICDGTQWSLRVNWPGCGRVWSDGSNAYPGRFQALLNAIKTLTHGAFTETL